MVRDSIIQSAVEKVIENTDLDPGEVNRNISKVMATMKKANEQFDQMDEHVNRLLGATQQLDESGTEMAQASVEMARASQNLAQSVDELNATQRELSDDMDDLQDTLDRLQNHMPEGEE